MTSSRSTFVVYLVTMNDHLRYECRAKGWFAAYQQGLHRLPPEIALRAIVVRGRPVEAQP